MKFAYSMLQDFVRTSKSAEEIGDLLTMAGFELEGIEDVEGEKMLDIRVVSNRGDGLSVLGLAREVLAKELDSSPTELYKRAAAGFPMDEDTSAEMNMIRVLETPIPNPPPSAGAQGEGDRKFAKVSIDTEDCTRFTARVFKGDFNLETPDWMQKRLRMAGMRSISLLVDLTNYVMLEIGQPMHAYDLEKLAGHKLIARRARNGEKLTTLNGEEHELNSSQIIIADAEKPVGAGGVMGGLDSEVSDSTATILLEAAHFVNTAVRKTRKQMGLSTEASYRFERSVDPEGAPAGQNRFAELLASLDGGKSRVDGMIDVYPSKPALATFKVRMSKVRELLGIPVSADEAIGYLKRLGFEVDGSGEEFTVTAPTWRPDVVQEYDVVEEIGRVHGYETIPEAPIQGTTTQGGVFGFDLYIEQIRTLMQGLGYVQNISSSLMDSHPLDDPRGERIGPRQPGSPEMSLLRNSIWPNLADNARRNGGANLQLFEIGAVFGNPEADSEVRKLGIIATGGPTAEHWEKQPTPAKSFYLLKTAVEEVLRQSSLELNWHPSHDSRLHPTRQAQLFDQPPVLFGQIHPDLAEELGLPVESFLAEVDLESIYSHRPEKPVLKPISRNPAVRRDIAILIDKSTPYAEIAKAINDGAGETLEKQWLFDVYEGKGIPEGKHSLAIALQLRKMGGNFTDEEANQVRDLALQALSALGATQR
ncbi:MAG TPA: phenylalanine--tRNA ligase subunit beta [Fimbriimonadaceae bacterium]|jgi:phenylalanyl-tRNA synthetase beta chain